MKKINWNKKHILWIIFSILTLGVVIAVLSIKIVFPFKPSFYTYSAYTDEKTIQQIENKYTYKEYATASDFEFALENNKAIAGVSSDYSLVSLILNGSIAPISQEVCYLNNIPENQWNQYEKFFNQASVDQMHMYDKYFANESVQKNLREKYSNQKYIDENGVIHTFYKDNYTFKFSDFIVPYFINDKVIAFDTKKVLNTTNTDINPLNFSSAPTLEEALKTINNESLKAVNTNVKIQWTKNERENVAMGGTIFNPGNDWNTEINKDNYMEWLNNFANIVKNGTGASISDVKRNLFDNDSDIILNNLINPTSKIDAAVIYNGDALDAYYGNDNFQDVQDGDRVRIVRTKYTIRILDAFVVSSSINFNDKISLLENFNSYLFKDMFLSKKEIENKANENPEQLYNDGGILQIFDYVNYTPAAKGAYEYILENYFNNDEIAKNIYQVALNNPNQNIFVRGIMPIEKIVLSKLVLAFQKKLNGY